MEKFQVFYERRARNPLRKKEISDEYGDNTNYGGYLDEKDVLPPEELEKLKRQEELQVPQDRIDAWKASKLKQQELLARRKWLRDKIPTDEFTKIYEREGIQFFMPSNEKVLNTPRMISLMRDLKYSTSQFLLSIKDLLPNRKPRFIIKDLGQTQNPYTAGSYIPALKYDNIIYLDIDAVEDPRYFIHEYAHYLADKAPKQIYPIIQAEYRKMLDNYFRAAKKKQRPHLEGQDDEKLRRKIAAKLGLPTEYSLVNPDEFFAEIITHWKNLPNNAASYNFKRAVKQVLSRL